MEAHFVNDIFYVHGMGMEIIQMTSTSIGDGVTLKNSPTRAIKFSGRI